MSGTTARPLPTATSIPTVLCVAVYVADLRTTNRWAFRFVPDSGRGTITIYAPAADTYRVGDRYTLRPI